MESVQASVARTLLPCTRRSSIVCIVFRLQPCVCLIIAMSATAESCAADTDSKMSEAVEEGGQDQQDNEDGSSKRPLKVVSMG